MAIKANSISLLYTLLFVALSSTVTINPTLPTQLYTDNCFITMGTTCIQCAFGYYLANGTCVVGQRNCKTYDPRAGVCTSCYVGYKLRNDSSCGWSQGTYLLQGCYSRSNQVCLTCYWGYYFNYDGNCQVTDDLCKVFSHQYKRCITCYQGYVYKPNYGRCVYVDSRDDSNCIRWQNYMCLSCNNGFYLQNGKCVESNPNCLTLSNASECLSCYRGYILQGNKCVVDPSTYNNYLCSQYNSNNQCVSCYYRSFLNSNSLCLPVNPLCLTFQEGGFCLTCYSGYRLINGTCLSEEQIVKDSNCAVWSADNCVSCIPWAYFNAENMCQPVSSLCRTFDVLNGGCTSCYQGYMVMQGNCILSNDQYCKEYTGSTCSSCYDGYTFNVKYQKCEAITTNCRSIEGGQCTSCYFSYYLQQGVCRLIDPLCQKFNEALRQCEGCYGGYQLVNSSCLVYP